MKQIEAHFENHKSVIETELKKATKTVYIAVAWINFYNYFESFVDLLKNRIVLKIICSDNWQNRSHQSKIDELKKLGAEIKLLKMPSGTNHMHHKFVIIDEETILNGSFNWSPNATMSMENILIIRDFPTVVTQFISEFNKLNSIEPQSITILQKQIKCQERGCEGEHFNILVLSENASSNYEVYGDIIQTCNSCDYWNILKECVSNTQIEFLLDPALDSPEDYDPEVISRAKDKLLDSYVSDEITIHAIGRVKTGLHYLDDDYVETNIIWKNKFVGDRIQDKFGTNFDVLYDN